MHTGDKNLGGGGRGGILILKFLRGSFLLDTILRVVFYFELHFYF
jgi:hypothetical protein